MYYSDTISAARIQAIKTLIDAGLSTGRLELMGGATVLAHFHITEGAMIYHITCYTSRKYWMYQTYTAGSTTADNTGVVSHARVVDSYGRVVIDNIPVVTRDLALDYATVNSSCYNGIVLNRLSFTAGDNISLNPSVDANFARFTMSSI